jgi:hypothetical protein
MAPPPPRPLRYTRRSGVVLVAPAGGSAVAAEAPPARVALSRLDVNNVVLTAHAALFYAEAIDEAALKQSLAQARVLGHGKAMPRWQWQHILVGVKGVHWAQQARVEVGIDCHCSPI